MSRTVIRYFLVPALFAVLLAMQPPISLAAELKPGEGLVILTRADKFKGKAIRFNINVNGSRNLQLLAGSTIELPLPSGTHTFSVYTPSLDGQDAITIDVQEGWTYHIEGYILLGWPTGRPKFKLVSESGPRSGAAATASPGTAAGQPGPRALADAALGVVPEYSAAGGQPGRNDAEQARIGLRNFVGDWSLEIWSLAADGSKLEGRGVAEASAESNQASPRKSTRVEIRSIDLGTWVADTYASVDGQSVHVQSYRFERRQ